MMSARVNREHLLAKNLPPLGPPVWTTPAKPVHGMRFALVTTAGLHYRDDPAFELADATFRPIDGQEDPDNLVMSHSSVNFDKTGFAEDVNLVFPWVDRLVNQVMPLTSLMSSRLNTSKP
jgi:D-proline reductase (dithiol) PrdB